MTSLRLVGVRPFDPAWLRARGFYVAQRRGQESVDLVGNEGSLEIGTDEAWILERVGIRIASSPEALGETVAAFAAHIGDSGKAAGANESEAHGWKLKRADAVDKARPRDERMII